MFDSILNYTLKESKKDGLHAIFSDLHLEYEVHIQNDSVDERFLAVSIISGASGCDKTDDLTGIGKPIPVLSTTVKIIHDHLNSYGIRPVRLLAADDKRCKLYYDISKKLFLNWHVFVASKNVILLPPSYFEKD